MKMLGNNETIREIDSGREDGPKLVFPRLLF
jgi:hypothetical protein